MEATQNHAANVKFNRTKTLVGSYLTIFLGWDIHISVPHNKTALSVQPSNFVKIQEKMKINVPFLRQLPHQPTNLPPPPKFPSTHPFTRLPKLNQRPPLGRPQNKSPLFFTVAKLTRARDNPRKSSLPPAFMTANNSFARGMRAFFRATVMHERARSVR